MAGHLEIGPMHSRLIWKGSIPVEISLLPFVFAPGKDGLDLRLHSERVDLSLSTSISKEVQSAEGPWTWWRKPGAIRINPGFPGMCGGVPGSLKLLHAGTALPPGPRGDPPPR